MQILTSVWQFISALRFVDIVFFFAVLILMILIVTLIYFIKINDDEKEEKQALEETQEMKIARELKEAMKQEREVNFSDYEKDQEEKAIISYDELLNKGSNYELNYETEEVVDDLSVKKIDIDNITKSSPNKQSVDGRVISFAKEEAFLQALKQLQKELG